LIPTLIPIIIVLISGLIVPIILSKYIISREKNQYIRILKTCCPVIKTYSYEARKYDITYRYLAKYVGLVFGIITGMFTVELFIFAIAFGQDRAQDGIWQNNYILNSILGMYNSAGLNTFQSRDIYSFPILIDHAWFIFFIVLMLWLLWSVFKLILPPSISTSGKFEPLSVLINLFDWSFVGMIFGLDICITLFIVTLIILLGHNGDALFNWNVLTSAYAKLKINVPNLINHVLIYYYFMGFSCASIVALVLLINSSSDKVINSLTDFHKHDFPYLKIKTESKEIGGQLRDIRNKHFVTITDKNMLIIVPWNKIEIIEVRNMKKNEHIIQDNDSINDK